MIKYLYRNPQYALLLGWAGGFASGMVLIAFSLLDANWLAIGLCVLIWGGTFGVGDKLARMCDEQRKSEVSHD